MNDHNCKYENDITEMKSNLGEIRTDVKSLLKFKWQMIGGVTVVSFMIAAVISILK